MDIISGFHDGKMKSDDLSPGFAAAIFFQTANSLGRETYLLLTQVKVAPSDPYTGV